MSTIAMHRHQSFVQANRQSIAGIRGSQGVSSIASSNDSAEKILHSGMEFINQFTGPTKELVSEIQNRFAQPAKDELFKPVSEQNKLIQIRLYKLYQHAFVSRNPELAFV